MKKTVMFVCVFLVALSLAAADQTEKPKSLYQRLGGYDAIAAVTDDFIGRLATDKTLAKFFAGHSQDSLKKIRMHVIDLICATAGGPCVYTGRDMKTSHQGLGISEAEWNLGVTHLTATLKKDIVEK